jgi:serine/threonine protein kinase
MKDIEIPSINHCTLKEEIQRGYISGIPYIVHHAVYHNKKVAIKILGSDVYDISQSEVIKTLIQSKTSHENVIQILEVRHQLIITGPFNGQTLSNFLRNISIPISFELQLSIAIDIINGLLFLHKRNILHQNLNSYNIYVDSTMRAKLTDFGFPNDSIRWNSLETINGHPYNHASEIYSFGVILWQLSTRAMPYEDEESGFVIKYYILEGIKNDIPTECRFSEIIKQCWDMPERRPTLEFINEYLSKISSNTKRLNIKGNLMKYCEKITNTFIYNCCCCS